MRAVLQFYHARHAARLAGAEQAAIAIRHLTGDLADETRQQVYVDHHYNEGGVSAGTIDRELSVLRAAIRFCGERWPGAEVPDILSLPRADGRTRWLTPGEADRLLSAAQSPHIRLFMLLMLATAARPEAVLDMQWAQVDFAGCRIHLNPEGRVQTSKTRPTVPLQNRALVAALRHAQSLAETDYVIEHAGYPVGSVKKGFRLTAERAGFRRGEVTPYVLRHTAATWMAQDGVPLWDIAGFLGHRDTRMVDRHYAHHHPDYLAQAGASLDSRLSGLAAARSGAGDGDMGASMRQDLAHKETIKSRRKGRKSLKNVVGAAGIEPATPTMST